MALSDDLSKDVKKIFKDGWTTRKGQVVPNPEDIALSNEAVVFDRATVLYADITGSTSLVDGYKWWFAAKIYKTFLHCAAKIIKSEGGSITAYDGDRVMGLFIGSSQTTTAARCALKINWARLNIINPVLKSAYPNDDYKVRHTVGIDTSEIRAARTGVRGDNDIVWVGRAANYAAKLTELSEGKSTWITSEAYSFLYETSKYGGEPKRDMWTKYTWSEHDSSVIYGSDWHWKV